MIRRALASACIVTLTIAAAASAQNARPTIAVVEFTNNAQNATWFHGSIGTDMADVLSNELSSTGDFNVVEREKIGAVMAEQDFARSGRVRHGSGPRTGNITGAHYLVTGSVSGYSEDTSDTGGGLNFRGFHIGGHQSQAYVAVDLRVVDSETSEVVYSRTVEGRSSDSGVSLGGYVGGGVGGDFFHDNHTPAAKAVRAALVEATDYLDCVMVKRDSCIASFDAKEQRRRQSDKDVLKLDGG